MKNAFVKKLLVLVAVFVALLQLFSLAVSATSDSVDWELSDDEYTLKNGEKTYKYYSSSVNLYPCAPSIYVYSDEVDMENEGSYYGGSCSVMQGRENDEIVWVEGRSENYFYVTDAGKAQIDKFTSGIDIYDVGSFSLSSSWSNQADMPMDIVLEIDYFGDLLTIDVKDLKNLTCYNVLARDKTNTVAYDYGKIFVGNTGTYYYLNLIELDNTHFDANGNLSYRNGQVDVVILDDEQIEAVRGVIEELAYFNQDYEYESGEYDHFDDYDDDDNDGELVFFWIFFVFFGYLLPIPCLVVGLVIANSDKHVRPKYWYVTAAIAAAWLVLSTVLLVLLLI